MNFCLVELLCVEKKADEFEKIVNDMLLSDKYNNLCNSARESYLENYSRESMGRRLNEVVGW